MKEVTSPLQESLGDSFDFTWLKEQLWTFVGGGGGGEEGGGGWGGGGGGEGEEGGGGVPPVSVTMRVQLEKHIIMR